MKALNQEVSIYKNVYDTVGTTIRLRDFILSDIYKSEIELIRKTTCKKERDQLKKQLPLITVSGIFEPTRSSENLVSHTGLMCVDIDQQDNTHITNFDKLKEQISNLKEVLFCGVSASGIGYYCIVQIKYPSKHIEHFRALEADWLRYGIVIDRNCKDVTRMRGYSYDDKPYTNESARVYSRLEESKQVAYYNINADNSSRIAKIAKELYSKRINVTENYDDWFVIGRVLAHELGESGRSFFHALSSLSTKYNRSECDKKFDKFKRTHTSPIGTFFMIAKENNILY